MILLDDAVRQALESNQRPGYQVTAYYGAEQTLDSVPVTTDGSLTFNGDQEIQGGGSVYLAKSGGESLVPRQPTDKLAPYGQELSIERTVAVSGRTVAIPLGRFRISKVPSAKEYFRRYKSQAVKAGWLVQLELKDRFDIIKADDFQATTSPVPGNSTWDEIQRLSPIPIVKSLPDRALPGGLVYQSRIDAMTQLMDNLGGVPHMTRQGALTARVADAWLTATTPVFTLNGVVEMDDGMSNDFYNSVVVSSSNDPNILAVAEVTDPTSPLSVSSPLGRRTYKHQDPLVTSQAQAQATADTMLARLSTRSSTTVKVSCIPRPDIELGDFGVAIDPSSGRQVKGEVSSMSFSMNPTDLMTLTMIVAEVI